MNQGAQILSSSSSSYFMGPTLFFEATKWTPEENKQFENALALYDKETPDRWHNVAQMIPGKTISDVINQYQKLEEDISDIEAGGVLTELQPGYNNNNNNIGDPVTLEWVANSHPQFYSLGGKKCASNRLPDHHEKKKGIPWTEEEHRQFLLGLKKYGKGDWRNISRNFVTTRTPTQVASHAQKYFIRQLSGGKQDKRRSSIHDITTLHITKNNTTTLQLHLENDIAQQQPAAAGECTSYKPPHHHPMAKAYLYQWSLPNQQHQQQQLATNMTFNLPANTSSMIIHGSSSYGSQYGHLGTVFQGNC